MRKLVEKEVHEKSMMEMKLTMKVWYNSCCTLLGLKTTKFVFKKYPVLTGCVLY